MTDGLVRKVVFTGDFLRPSVSGLRPTQHENIFWLKKLLETPILMASGIDSEIVHWDNNPINGAVIDSGTVRAIYEAFLLKPTIQSWPTVFSATELPSSVEDTLLPLFQDSFVVGFELPPYLANLLNRYEIGFVDFSLSPVRFMDDLLFEIRSNITAITNAIRSYETPQALIRLQAGVVSSNVAKANPHPPLPGSLLLILQTSYDKAVICGNRFVTALDYMDELCGLAAGYSNVLVREHPLESRTEIRDMFLKVLPNATLTTENFYRLISHHNLQGVVALSSSCIQEARYFGKTAISLIAESDRVRPAGRDPVIVGDDMLTPDFWRDVLCQLGCSVSERDGLRLASKPNRFRQQLRSAWGYNQIDTDIAINWAVS